MRRSVDNTMNENLVKCKSGHRTFFLTHELPQGHHLKLIYRESEIFF